MFNSATVMLRKLSQILAHQTRSMGEKRLQAYCTKSTSQFSDTAEPYTVSTSKVSPHLYLRKVNRSETLHEDRGKPRTLVLLLPWLGAKGRSLDRHCSFYHERGMDVLDVQCNLKHFFVPSSGQALAVELLDYLAKNYTPLSTDVFLVHAFSIGAYVYTLVLQELQDKSKAMQYGVIMHKIKGQIFDSLTIGGFHQMANGVAELSKNMLTQTLLKILMASFFFLSRPFTETFYVKAIDSFKAAPVKTPVLLFYCLNDPMSDARAIEAMLDGWYQDPRLDVHVKCWESSKHAAHLQQHPEQYIKAQQGFLKVLELEPAQVLRARL